MTAGLLSMIARQFGKDENTRFAFDTHFFMPEAAR